MNDPSWSERSQAGSVASTPAGGSSPESRDPGKAVLPAALSSAPDVMGLLQALRRRWLLAASAGLGLAAAVATATWCVLPVKHTARALLYMASSQPTVVFQTTEGRADFATYQRTQLALVKSRLVLNAALRQPDVGSLSSVREQLDPVPWLENQIKVDYSGGPEILRISMTSSNAEEAVVLVNAVAKAYLTEIADKERNRRLARLDQLKDLQGKYEGALRRKRATVRQLAEDIGSGDAHTLALKQRFAQEQLAQAERDLLQLQSNLRKEQIELDLRQARDRAADEIAVPDWAVDELLRRDPAVQKLLARREQLEEAVRDAIRVFVRPERHAEKVWHELEDNAAALRASRDQFRPLIEQQLRNQAREERQALVARRGEQVEVMKKWEESLVRDISRLREETRTLNKGSVDLESFRQDIAQEEETAKKVAAEVEALTVEVQAPARVTPLEDAVAPLGQDQKRQALIAGGAGAGSFGLVVLLVAWLEFRSRRVNSVEQVVQGLGMNLVGTLPALPRQGRPRWVGREGLAGPDWRNLLTESVDAARTMLLHAARAQSLRLVMVTSATGGEGKTSLASQLAASLARSGRNTLLVDCDLRNPTAHRLFNLPRQPGLSELLCGEAELAEAVHPTWVGGLSLLPTGRSGAQAIQALAQEHLPRVFERLKPHYDFIVIDSPPVLPVADSLLIGQYADAVILSVLHGVSRLPKVYAACQRLAMLGIHTLGAVVSGAPADDYGAPYQYARPAENETASATP